MLTVLIPDNFIPERTYIVNMLAAEFLGLACKVLVRENMRHYEIILCNGNRLIIRDHFFSEFGDGTGYIDEKNIPEKIGYGRNRFTCAGNIPVIFGNDELHVGRSTILCGIDIFASSFFMLTRWEEYANSSRDSHHRFPSSASLAGKNGFIHRAVVNEYVELLWNMLLHLGITPARKKREFRTYLTHDVDSPFLYATNSPFAALKQAGGDLLKRRSPGLALNNFNSWARVMSDGMEQDPFNTFDWIMDLSELYGRKSSFLFIADCGQPAYDGNYRIDNRFVRRLMANIHRRGHEIGLHLSYGSVNSPVQTKKEFDKLKTVCGGEGIEQESWTSRQHFLRWETPSTFENLEFAHIDYDSTLSYADAAGFRCGVCYEYPAFNALTRSRLNLRERPLHVMECTVIDERYMGLGAGEEAFALIRSIKDTCRSFNGDFTVLWHNTRFIDPQERELYHRMLLA